MTQFAKSFSIAVTALGFLGSVTAAHAGAKLYAGTVIFHAFGNTVVQSTTMGMAETRPSYLTNTFYAEPLGAFCNYNNLTMHVSMGKVYTGTMVLNTVYPNAMGTMTCQMTTGTRGAPLLGSGTLSTLTTLATTADTLTFAPATAAIVLPGGNVFDTISGSFPYTYPFIYTVHYATGGTGPGTLFAGGGPGNIYQDPPGGQFGGYASTTAGPNQFGGTAKLLGDWSSTGFFYSGGQGYFIPSIPWPFKLAGKSYRGYECPVLAAMVQYNDCPSVNKHVAFISDGYRNRAYTMGGAYVTTASYGYGTAFPWTTGTAFITAVQGGLATIIERHGYDNRSPNGEGVIQLVTPQLANWINPGFAFPSGHIALLRLQIAPEPGHWLLLGSGALLLAVLRRLRRR